MTLPTTHELKQHEPSELKSLKHRVNSVLKSKRAGRPKRRKSVSQEYRDYLSHHEKCLACGRTREQRPAWFNGEWGFHKAHICNKPRKNDVRVVVCLCAACHFVSHGIKFPDCNLPPLTVANLLWIKRESGERFDPAFIRTCSVQELPTPEPLPEAYREAGR